MSDEAEQARRARAEVRRLTWTFEPLTPEHFAASQPWPGHGSHAERLEHAELLRRMKRQASIIPKARRPSTSVSGGQ